MDLMIQFEEEIITRTQKIDIFLSDYFISKNFNQNVSIQKLLDSVRYSLMSGGKRFRPVLSLLVGEAFSQPIERFIPYAAAVEIVHTYSLIHDDLPSMDNDDERRGRPTNHKIFGESMALLAGDALLTESFRLLATAYTENSFQALELVEILSRAIGVNGMVGGQAIDLDMRTSLQLNELIELHRLKTGALIAAAVEGASVLAGASVSEMRSLKLFAEKLGLAFQISDDLLDFDQIEEQHKNFVGLMGVDETKKYLAHLSEEVLFNLHQVIPHAPLIEYLIHYNQNRKK